MPPRPESSAVRLRPWAFVLLLLMVPLSFILGRQMAAPIPSMTPVSESTEDPPLSDEPDDGPVASVSTSTIGLCPCPKPRKPRVGMRPIGRKKSPTVVTPPFERPDPTKATAAYLKRHASRLAACAPSGGSRLRVHLEVQVAPTGAIEWVKTTNLEPIPGTVQTCVENEMRALTPPGFDATEPETFALTAVL